MSPNRKREVARVCLWLVAAGALIAAAGRLVLGSFA
jgi:hypothetical protein